MPKLRVLCLSDLHIGFKGIPQAGVDNKIDFKELEDHVTQDRTSTLVNNIKKACEETGGLAGSNNSMRRYR